MNEKDYKINEGLKMVVGANVHEKNGDYYQAAKEYQKAREIFKKVGINKLYAKCWARHAANMIKYYEAMRDIEHFSPNFIVIYFNKIDGIMALELSKFEKYSILRDTYQELEEFFKDVNMVDGKKAMYYKKKSLYHKYYWQSARQKGRRWISKIGNIFNSFVYWFFHSFCGHGERAWKALIWIFSTILIFSGIFKFFDLIAFDPPGKTLCFWQSLYFSIVTFTTLGYGDIVPKGPVGQFFVSVEVILGYIMLGALISLFWKKITE